MLFRRACTVHGHGGFAFWMSCPLASTAAGAKLNMCGCQLPSTSQTHSCRPLQFSSLLRGHKSRIMAPKAIVYAKKSHRRKVKAWLGMQVKDVAAAVDADVDDVVVSLMEMHGGVDADENTAISEGHVISTLLQSFGCAPTFVRKQPTSPATLANEAEHHEDVHPRPPPDPAVCKPRAPVVTIMGHVDHGKTTLLDALRNSQIVDTEFGGITQHIGAFSVVLPVSKRRITFLDTPGHAAFHAMRSRGAQATDLVVLVVAADDGVMEQTIESVRFAREAEVPILVAINKIDKANADIERTKRTLGEIGIYIEEMGGSTQAVPISALKGENLDDLQEAILAEAEILELKADYDGPVEGVIVESRTRHGLGKATTALVQRGTLKVGDVLVAGLAWCKVRKMRDEHAKSVKEATPSTPVEIIGWRSDLPSAGDVLLQVESEAVANRVVRYRSNIALMEKGKSGEAQNERTRQELYDEYVQKRTLLREAGRVTGYVVKAKMKNTIDLSQSFNARLDVLIKGDVAGSVEAIIDVLETYDSTLCHLDIINFGVGPVTESDVEMAAPFKGVIYAFNTPVPRDVAAKAAEAGVEIRSTNIIYRLVEFLIDELNQRLPEVEVEEVVGEGHVIQQFAFKERKQKRFVAGCRVESGVISKGDRVRFIRNGAVVYDGPIVSLQKEKEQVTSVSSNSDAGIRVDDPKIVYNIGDDVVCYRMAKKRQTIDWSPPGF